MINAINQITERTAVKASKGAAEKLSKVKFVFPALALPAALDKDCFQSKQNYDSNPFGCDSAAVSWLC